jgi:transposase
MLNPTPATRIFVALAPVDLRASFNRLSAWVQEQLREDPLSGHVYVFTNRRRNRLKLLYWDGSGLWVCGKRLERGRFSWPQAQGLSLNLRAGEWNALVNGLEVRAKASWYRQ